MKHKFRVVCVRNDNNWIMGTSGQVGCNSFIITRCHKEEEHTCKRNYNIK